LHCPLTQVAGSTHGGPSGSQAVPELSHFWGAPSAEQLSAPGVQIVGGGVLAHCPPMHVRTEKLHALPQQGCPKPPHDLQLPLWHVRFEPQDEPLQHG
jgi:hypothetical protein